jgi:hypothetical protein
MKTKVNYSAEISIPYVPNVYFGTAGMYNYFKISTSGHDSQEQAEQTIRDIITALQKALDE